MDDIISHAEIIKTVKRLVSRNKLPHLLFYGPPGTGKTSTILAVAKEMFGEAKLGNMVLQLNASDDRGIKTVRDEIKTLRAQSCSSPAASSSSFLTRQTT